MKWVIIFFTSACFSIIIACGESNLTNDGEGEIVNIRFIEKETNKPIVGIEVQVLLIKKPLFSIRQFHELVTVYTNENGNCTFKVKREGQYSLRLYDNNKLVYRTDEIVIDNIDNIENYTITF